MTDQQFDALSSPMPTSDFIAAANSLASDPNFSKCPRCWHYTRGGIFNHDGLCDRCCTVIAESHPQHPSVPDIAAARAEQQRMFSSLVTKAQMEAWVQERVEANAKRMAAK